MRIAFILIFLFSLNYPIFAKEQNTLPQISAQDLAKFLNIQDRQFLFQHQKNLESVAYQFKILKKGQPISEGTKFIDQSVADLEGSRLLRILYQDQGESLKVSLLSNDLSLPSKLNKPKSVQFDFSHSQLYPDQQGRIMIAYSIEEDLKGQTLVNAKKSSIDGADYALILQITFNLKK